MFPGARGAGLSNMSFLMLLRRMGRGDLTAHGFRSSFRDWTAERTSFPREVAEQALAHTLSDKVEAAYRRSDLFDKRRKLMDAWARFCVTPAGEKQGAVMPLRISRDGSPLVPRAARYNERAGIGRPADKPRVHRSASPRSFDARGCAR